MTRGDICRRLGPGLLAVALVAAACSGGGGDDDELGLGTGRRGSDQPAGDSDADVRPILEDLVEEHDELVNEIIADPSVARDEDNELIQAYLRLYVPDSDIARQVVETWQADGEAGHTTHAIETGLPAVRLRIAGAIESVNEDKVHFLTCSELRYVRFDADGNRLEVVPYREQPGQATAVRVEGQWLLQQLDAFEGQAACAAGESTTEEP